MRNLHLIIAITISHTDIQTPELIYQREGIIQYNFLLIVFPGVTLRAMETSTVLDCVTTLNLTPGEHTAQEMERNLKSVIAATVSPGHVRSIRSICVVFNE